MLLNSQMSFGINLNAQHVNGMTRYGYHMACKDGQWYIVKLLK